MLKKIIGICMSVLLLISISGGSYAEMTIEFNDADSLTLIEPNIGSESQVVVRDVLTISIRPQDKETVCLSLYKTMAAQEDELLTEVIADLEEEFDVISRLSIVQDDELEDDDILTDDINILQTSDSKDGTLEQRKEVVVDFSNIQLEFEQKAKEFQTAKEAMHQTYDYDNFAGYKFTDEDDIALNKYFSLIEQMKLEVEKFKQEQKNYVALFKEPVFELESITRTGVVPYYNTTIDDISAGYYELVFSDKDTHKILKVVNFEIIKKEAITEDVIRDTVLEYTNPLLEPLN